MSRALVISVRLHEGWYHGAGSVPSPARLFQALVAGCGLSGPLHDEDIAALEWLERLPPPVIAMPSTTVGQAIKTFVPNNDLDAKCGDYRRIGDIRAEKLIRPLIFDGDVPFIYSWPVGEQGGNETALQTICEMTDQLYQFGRAVDAAWAWAEVLSGDQLDGRLCAHHGPVMRPSIGPGTIQCPAPGSLSSLMARHAGFARRFSVTSDRKGLAFRRRPKAKWRMVSYNENVTRVCFDLTDRETSAFMPWQTNNVLSLVTEVRDKAVERLQKALPDRANDIRRALVGRKKNGENAGPAAARVRIIPLPSIGHKYADQQIRRILIEVPGACPLHAEDVVWAFSNLMFDFSSRKVDLLLSQAHRQLEHFGIETKKSCFWQTVTPAALSSAPRRRIEPDKSKRHVNDLKGVAQRRFEQERAAFAVRQSLRHEGVRANVRSMRVQREPFSGQGYRTDDFAVAPRFSKHVLWHVELEVETPIAGPLVIGDGRFCGLGLMRPTQTPPSNALI
jgi:CRISPR-associated protein Csb2